jgi:hypothetical protein
MIGTPPSARPAIPADPAEHAVQFARVWEDITESCVQRRMRELGIPEHQIGAIEYAQGGVRRAFDPQGVRGGTNDAFGRIYIDSGVFNPDLLGKNPDPRVRSLRKESRVRDRMDAIIAHEHTEVQGISHEQTVEQATDTDLPIRPKARHLLRVIAGREEP